MLKQLAECPFQGGRERERGSGWVGANWRSSEDHGRQKENMKYGAVQVESTSTTFCWEQGVKASAETGYFNVPPAKAFDETGDV